MRRRSERLPSEAELALWAEVAKHVRPFPGRKLPAMIAGDSGNGAPAPSAAPVARPAPEKPAALPALPPLAPLERKLRTRLRRGQQPIEGVIDLHGMRQDEAHGALIRFLERASARGARMVLVVTGKGGGATGGNHAARGLDDLFQERGVLRRNVPHWLRMPELRPLVMGFEEAEAGHGGVGALYVRLRRKGMAE
jgi:DNA-nicking Smr family endonuclease